MRIICILSLLVPLSLFAQDVGSGQPPSAGPCSGPEYRQFDFWLGDWTVLANGEPAGTNSVRVVLGGCALQENWQGAGEGGISGSSFNAYDRATGRWHQTWVDSSGTLLQLDGGLAGGSMILSGERPAREGGTVLHRISWTPGEDDSVRQLWEASQDGGKSWSVMFDGQYIRSAEAQ
jgi:hypothetical protein